MDTLISCLRNYDCPAAQVAAAETIMLLPGRFTGSGKPLTRAILLMRAGLGRSYRSLIRTAQLGSFSKEIEVSLVCFFQNVENYFWIITIIFLLLVYDFIDFPSIYYLSLIFSLFAGRRESCWWLGKKNGFCSCKPWVWSGVWVFSRRLKEQFCKVKFSMFWVSNMAPIHAETYARHRDPRSSQGLLTPALCINIQVCKRHWWQSPFITCSKQLHTWPRLVAIFEIIIILYVSLTVKKENIRKIPQVFLRATFNVKFCNHTVGWIWCHLDLIIWFSSWHLKHKDKLWERYWILQEKTK